MLPYHAQMQRGEGGGPKNRKKKIGFLSNNDRDPLKNHKTPKPAFNVRPQSAGQTAFCWRADDDPLLEVFG